MTVLPFFRIEALRERATVFQENAYLIVMPATAASRSVCAVLMFKRMREGREFAREGRPPPWMWLPRAALPRGTTAGHDNGRQSPRGAKVDSPRGSPTFAEPVPGRPGTRCPSRSGWGQNFRSRRRHRIRHPSDPRRRHPTARPVYPRSEPGATKVQHQSKNAHRGRGQVPLSNEVLGRAVP